VAVKELRVCDYQKCSGTIKPTSKGVTLHPMVDPGDGILVEDLSRGSEFDEGMCARRWSSQLERREVEWSVHPIYKAPAKPSAKETKAKADEAKAKAAEASAT